MQLKFKGLARIVGDSVIVTIPAAYIQNYNIAPGTEYNFTIEVTENDRPIA